MQEYVMTPNLLTDVLVLLNMSIQLITHKIRHH